jgi:hypothetical protein
MLSEMPVPTATGFGASPPNELRTSFVYRSDNVKRYFVEWRKRALIRRELRMSSDRQSWEDIIPPTPPAHDV